MQRPNSHHGVHVRHEQLDKEHKLGSVVTVLDSTDNNEDNQGQHKGQHCDKGCKGQGGSEAFVALPTNERSAIST